MDKLLRNALLAISLGLWSTLGQAEGVTVRTAMLGEVMTSEHFSAPATVVSFNRPQIAAEVSGRILRLSPRVGETVAAGQALAEIDCRSYVQREKTMAAALARARSQWQFAKDQLDRARNLEKKNSISEELLQQRRTEVATSLAEVDTQTAQHQLAQIDVEHCGIKAPFEALVSKRLASEGSLASPGTPLLELVQLTQLEVAAELRADQAQALADIESAQFLYQGSQHPVKLRVLPPLIEEKNRTCEARLMFVNESAPIGAAGRLLWQGRGKLVPAQYLVRREENLGIFIAHDHTAKFIVLPDAIEGQPARVELADEVPLITAGRQRLYDGDAIHVDTSGQAE